MKAVNAAYISSIFLKNIIENSQSGDLKELYLSLDESEPIPKEFIRGNQFRDNHYSAISNELK